MGIQTQPVSGKILRLTLANRECRTVKETKTVTVGVSIGDFKLAGHVNRHTVAHLRRGAGYKLWLTESNPAIDFAENEMQIRQSETTYSFKAGQRYNGGQHGRQVRTTGRPSVRNAVPELQKDENELCHSALGIHQQTSYAPKNATMRQ